MFTQKVIDELQSYVYALVDPRNDCIFYIEKGKGNRAFQHAEDALQENTDSHNLKLETIRSILMVRKPQPLGSLPAFRFLQNW